MFQECAKNDAVEFSSQLYFRVSRSFVVEESIEGPVTFMWWRLSEIAPVIAGGSLILLYSRRRQSLKITVSRKRLSWRVQ